jgi:hypothetical protein
MDLKAVQAQLFRRGAVILILDEKRFVECGRRHQILTTAASCRK